jgi:hypothetical protein
MHMHTRQPTSTWITFWLALAFLGKTSPKTQGSNFTASSAAARYGISEMGTVPE